MMSLMSLQAVVVTAFTFRRKGNVLFTYHPVFMVVAFAALVLGIVQFHAPPGPGTGNRLTVRGRHYRANAFAGVCVATGVVVIVSNKVVANKVLWPNSWHSWLGILASLLLLFQVSRSCCCGCFCCLWCGCCGCGCSGCAGGGCAGGKR